jgi:glyoxylate reductase
LAFDPFGREAIEADELATWADLPQLLEHSDFVTLHPPLTPDTHHLISEAELQAMKESACLINAARGPVVDEKALVKALQEGWIAGAALDVFEDEPAMAPGLAELDNVSIFPHIASASHDTRSKMASIAATNALAHLRREPAPNVVNPEVYETEAYRRRVG